MNTTYEIRTIYFILFCMTAYMAAKDFGVL